MKVIQWIRTHHRLSETQLRIRKATECAQSCLVLVVPPGPLAHSLGTALLEPGAGSSGESWFHGLHCCAQPLLCTDFPFSPVFDCPSSPYCQEYLQWRWEQQQATFTSHAQNSSFRSSFQFTCIYFSFGMTVWAIFIMICCLIFIKPKNKLNRKKEKKKRPKPKNHQTLKPNQNLWKFHNFEPHHHELLQRWTCAFHTRLQNTFFLQQLLQLVSHQPLANGATVPNPLAGQPLAGVSAHGLSLQGPHSWAASSTVSWAASHNSHPKPCVHKASLLLGTIMCKL